MQILYFIAICLVLTQLALYNSAVNKVDQPVAMMDAQDELAKYRTFAYAADMYVKARPYTGGGATETITWTQIKVETTTPPGAQQVNLPATWMIRRNASRWVLCAPLSEVTVAMMTQLLPSAQRSPIPGAALAGALSNTLVVGETNVTEAAAYANLCL